MLRYLGERKHPEALFRLTGPSAASGDAARLPQLVDLVLVVDTYHHIDNRTAYFAKLGESLRPDGTASDHRLQGRCARGPSARVPHAAREGDGRT